MANKNGWKIFSIVAIVLMMVIAIGGLGVYTGFISFEGTQVVDSTVEANQQVANCPDTKQTSVTITLKNDEDETTDDTFDATGYLYKIVNGVEEYDQSITDTTAGSVNLDCLTTYRLRLVTSDADEGDNAKLNRIIAGVGASLVDGGKAVEFTPSGRSYTLKVGGERHGVLEFKMWDNVLAGWQCNSDDVCTDYEADGVTFESTTNGTAITIGATSEIDSVLHFRSTKANTSFDDYAYYLLVEAGTDTATKWQDPVLTLNGNRLSKTALTGNEARLWQSYDWAYLIEGHDINDADNELKIMMKPQTGQDPSTDLQFDFASSGAYLSIDGSTVGYGGAKDDTSATVVYTIQDVTVNIG